MSDVDQVSASLGALQQRVEDFARRLVNNRPRWTDVGDFIISSVIV